MQDSQDFTNLNLSNLLCTYFYPLLYLIAQLHAKVDPKRLKAEVNKALTVLFTKKRESSKESMERQEEKIQMTQFYSPSMFSIKIYFTYST